ncbi:MAG TPA: hypothetical protein VFI96_00655 [Longimicrobiaceae bacterium]|nr:hypothetical protein [Longimicrobiaceae bacterium]
MADEEKTQANRDRSDLKGSPKRPAEQTGTRGSGRSDANPPAPERNTRSKQKP